jgi:hypothetical protein
MVDLLLQPPRDPYLEHFPNAKAFEPYGIRELGSQSARNRLVQVTYLETIHGAMEHFRHLDDALLVCFISSTSAFLHIVVPTNDKIIQLAAAVKSHFCASLYAV